MICQRSFDLQRHSMAKSIHSEQYVGVLLALLRAARTKSGLTQEELAAALKVDRTIVTKVESGVRRLDAVETFEWIRACGVRYGEFAAELEKQFDALDIRNAGGKLSDSS